MRGIPFHFPDTTPKQEGRYLGESAQGCGVSTPTATCTRTPTVTPTTTANRPPLMPVPLASPNPARSGETVTLDGSRSTGGITSYDSTQTAGPTVALDHADTVRATFVAPAVFRPATLTFRLHLHGIGGSPPIFEAEASTDVVVDPAVCAGDCDGSQTVTVDDLLGMVNVALGLGPVGECPVGDVNGDGAITVDEITGAVTNALDGCWQPPPTPTPTATFPIFCTPPPCATGEVYHCPRDCSNGCGLECATPTPTKTPTSTPT